MSNVQPSTRIKLMCEELRARHQALARYRLYHFDCRKPRQHKKREIERDLTYEQACEKRDQLNAELKSAGKAAFGDPRYEIQLTNVWDCMSETAKAQNLALGKTRKDFDN